MNCPYCHRPARWVSNELIYGRRYGRSYMAWWCEDCDAHVGCHNNTRTPLGTMANAPLRKLRMRAHQAFDPLWEQGGMSRHEAYRRLNVAFGREMHIGESDEETCHKIIQLCHTGALLSREVPHVETC